MADVTPHENKNYYLLGNAPSYLLVFTHANGSPGHWTFIFLDCAGPDGRLQHFRRVSLGVRRWGRRGAHLAVNMLNEYFDFKSGLDFKTQRTPFSGGSGTLPANPHLARQALTTAIVSQTISRQ